MENTNQQQSPITVINADTTEKKKSGDGIKTAVLCFSMLAVVLAGAGFTLSLIDHIKNSTPYALADGADGNSVTFTDGSIADVASKVSPAVVSITTETRTSSWFGQGSISTSAGTGMIVTKDGYVLTNKHVIDGANRAKVIMDDGTTYDNVTIVGADPLNDVAFLKINGAKDLPTVTLGNSKTLTAGQQVIAIGNALGQYSNSVTEGIISGTGRSITASDSDKTKSETLTDMIQTDASINPGNSGGPLVNAAGQVIGINTAVSSNAQGIGFAIPITSVKGMLKTVLKTKKVQRPYLGISYVSVTPDIAKERNLSANHGAYVYSEKGNAIVPNGPADKVEIQEKDVIISVNGTEIGAAGSVSTLVGEYAVGDKIQIKVLRGKEELSFDITVEAYPSNASPTQTSNGEEYKEEEEDILDYYERLFGN